MPGHEQEATGDSDLHYVSKATKDYLLMSTVNKRLSQMVVPEVLKQDHTCKAENV